MSIDRVQLINELQVKVTNDVRRSLRPRKFAEEVRDHWANKEAPSPWNPSPLTKTGPYATGDYAESIEIRQDRSAWAGSSPNTWCTPTTRTRTSSNTAPVLTHQADIRHGDVHLHTGICSCRKNSSPLPWDGPVTELLYEGVDDIETVVISWLTPLRRCSNTRRSGDVLPFTVVTHIAGEENVDESYADPVVSVHTLCDRALGWLRLGMRRTQRTARCCSWPAIWRMCDLGGGRMASIDYVKVFSMPKWEPYGDDQILRKVGRYQIGLSYAAVP